MRAGVTLLTAWSSDHEGDGADDDVEEMVVPKATSSSATSRTLSASRRKRALIHPSDGDAYVSGSSQSPKDSIRTAPISAASSTSCSNHMKRMLSTSSTCKSGTCDLGAGSPVTTKGSDSARAAGEEGKGGGCWAGAVV